MTFTKTSTKQHIQNSSNKLLISSLLHIPTVNEFKFKRVPAQVLGQDRYGRHAHFVINLIQDFLISTKINLVFNFFYQINILHSIHNIHFPDSSVINNVLNREAPSIQGPNVVDDFLSPEA